ncbi:MAG: aspartate aminotransferase family protein [Deltaproteobacteria bacterium]|nr:aspartate aminotransferase family protein [Deltaproteobacteria bacterium]
MSKRVIRDAGKYISPALVFHSDIVVRKAKGIYVEGEDGRVFMDFTSGLATANLGHSPTEVIKAARAQMDRLVHSGCIFYYESEVELAKRLKKITPRGIDMFFFSNSGAEAVEGAIKLARFYTGRQGILAFMGGFHGRTLGALTLTASAVKYRKKYHPLLPSVYHSPYPYCYRCPMGQRVETCSIDCIEYLERVFKYQISPDEVACAVIEPVLGEGGYIAPPMKFMKRLKDICRREGILIVADEVQTGFGRTGRWFASDHFDLDPDIITLGKGIASGFPLSALGARRSIMSKWTPGAHGTTFGGNPVSCAAACATIDKTERDKVLLNAQETGAHALKRLRALKEMRRSIGDVRGLGLMIGVEFIKKDGSPDKEETARVIKKCLKAGLVLIECGVDKNVIRIMPPLTVTVREMKKALDIFEEAVV